MKLSILPFLLFSLLVVSITIRLEAQDLSSYIEQHAQITDLETLQLDFSNSKVAESDLIFFGFIHGCAVPQELDFQLLEYFVKQQGLKYYAPEVDYSQAYFLNRYLQSGEEAILDFVLYFYAKRVPQDASTQLRQKWKKIYELNRSLAADQKLHIIGTDFPSSDIRIAITHLAHLIGDQATGNEMLDSLKLYENLIVEDRRIWSGKPAMEIAKKYGGYTMDYVYPIDSKWNFSNRFFDYYLANQDTVLSILKQFDENAADILNERAKKREDHIFENFKHKIIPLIEQGEQVYANFGYAHIHQAPIYSRCYLACKIKEKFPAITVSSILGLLAKSKALKHWKVKKGGPFTTDRGLVFNKMELKGYKTSASYDGHGFFEQLLGVKQLIKASADKEILLLDLDRSNSPFAQSPYLVDYKIGGRHTNIDPNSNTLQYFQYVILMQHSEANVPLNYQKE
ncbi:MAG: hypothetical protein AAGG68_17965 [Bacteroidota bacterium]